MVGRKNPKHSFFFMVKDKTIDVFNYTSSYTGDVIFSNADNQGLPLNVSPCFNDLLTRNSFNVLAIDSAIQVFKSDSSKVDNDVFKGDRDKSFIDLPTCDSFDVLSNDTINQVSNSDISKANRSILSFDPNFRSVSNSDV